jgi:hypothetical protein
MLELKFICLKFNQKLILSVIAVLINLIQIILLKFEINTILIILSKT